MSKRGPNEVKIIYIKSLAAFSALAVTAAAAAAQDFTAGKTPAQLFSSDCSTCHRSPDGLGKKYNMGALAGFLRAHYTTKQESAGALAKYVMGFATLPRTATTSPSADEGTARSGEEKGRRHSDVSGDGEKKKQARPAGDQAAVGEEPPRPPAAIMQPATASEAAVHPAAASRNARPPRAQSSESESSPPVAKLNDYAHSGGSVVSREAGDPMSRIRAYATSGADPQEAAAEAPKPVSGKPHRRGDNGAQPLAAAGDPAAPADSVLPAAAEPNTPAPATRSAAAPAGAETPADPSAK
jgi:hypothetical protein